GALGHETLGGGLQAAKLAGVGIRLAAAARDEDEDHLPDLAGRHPAVHEEKALPETTGAGRLLPVAVEEKENRVANLPVLRRVVARRQAHRGIPLRSPRSAGQQDRGGRAREKNEEASEGGSGSSDQRSEIQRRKSRRRLRTWRDVPTWSPSPSAISASEAAGSP